MSKIPDHSDLTEMEWECDELGVTLTCFFDFEPESRGAREAGTGLQLEPDYPATHTLMHAYLPDGLDISPVLAPKLIAEIEEYMAEEFQRNWEAELADEAYDRWLDSQQYPYD